MSNDVVLPATGAVVETVDQGGTGTTNSTTASGNATLHFASTPAFVSVGMGISDTTAPTVIPAGTTVVSFTGTTVVMSANATGSGVGSGDTIAFTSQRQVVHIGSQSSQGASAAVSLTRTADTNAYAAGDVIGSATGSTAALTFASMGPSAGGDVMITSASLEIDASAVISGETSYRLYLYNVTPPSALGDNVAWDLPSGDRASFLGYIDFGSPVDLGSTLYVQQDSINKQIKAAGSSLFGYLVTNGAYTPTSARVHVITLHSVAL